MATRTWLAALLLSTLACSGPPDDTPEATYQAFYRAIAEKDWDRAVSFLSPRVVERFREVGQRLSQLNRYPIDPMDYFLRSVEGKPVIPLRKIEVISRSEGTVTLQVTAGPCGEEQDERCSEERVKVRRYENRWLLEPDMPVLLTRPADTSGGEGV